MHLLGFLLAVCCIPGWNSFAVQTGWVVLSFALPFLLVRRLDLGPAHWLGLGFLSFAVISLAWTPLWEQGIWALWLLAVASGGFILGSSELDFKRLYVGLAWGIGISLNIAIFQYLGWNRLPQYGGGLVGLFVNPGVFGEVAALVTIGLVAYGAWTPLLFTIPSVAISGSRTALAALAAAASLALFRATGWKAIVGVLILLVALGAWSSRRGLASMTERANIWMDTVQALTPFGHGTGSFVTLYPAYATRTDTMSIRPETPHNEYLELAFEYGLGSFLLGGILLLAFLGNSRGPERYAAVGFLLVAAFGFPRQIPIATLLGSLALGRLCAGRYALRLVGLPRGPAYIRGRW